MWKGGFGCWQATVNPTVCWQATVEEEALIAQFWNIADGGWNVPSVNVDGVAISVRRSTAVLSFVGCAAAIAPAGRLARTALSMAC